MPGTGPRRPELLTAGLLPSPPGREGQEPACWGGAPGRAGLGWGSQGARMAPAGLLGDPHSGAAAIRWRHLGNGSSRGQRQGLRAGFARLRWAATRETEPALGDLTPCETNRRADRRSGARPPQPCPTRGCPDTRSSGRSGCRGSAAPGRADSSVSQLLCKCMPPSRRDDKLIWRSVANLRFGQPLAAPLSAMVQPQKSSQLEDSRNARNRNAFGCD